jgi:hypothetical protein
VSNPCQRTETPFGQSCRNQRLGISRLDDGDWLVDVTAELAVAGRVTVYGMQESESSGTSSRTVGGDTTYCSRHDLSFVAQESSHESNGSLVVVTTTGSARPCLSCNHDSTLPQERRNVYKPVQFVRTSRLVVLSCNHDSTLHVRFIRNTPRGGKRTVPTSRGKLYGRYFARAARRLWVRNLVVLYGYRYR